MPSSPLRDEHLSSANNSGLRRASGVLTAPDFEWNGPPLSETCLSRAGGSQGWIDAALDAMRDENAKATAVLAQKLVKARVGGMFWGFDPSAALRELGDRPLALLRPGNLREAEQMISLARGWKLTPCLIMPTTAHWKSTLHVQVEEHDGILLHDPVDPWPLLDRCDRVIVDGNDTVGFLALLAGKPVTCVQAGFLSGRGLTHDVGLNEHKAPRSLHQLAEAVLSKGTRYIDPFTGHPATCEAVIELLEFWRGFCHENRDVACCTGMALWKRRDISRFFHNGSRSVPFFAGARRPTQFAKKHGGAVAVWATKETLELAASTSEAGVPMYRVEDGFIRSRGLGSDLYPPMSIVVDRHGMYYDPTSGSDLEVLLSRTEFNAATLRRARFLRRMLVTHRITKYGNDEGNTELPLLPQGRRCVLVPGQVTDDASLRLGGAGVSCNLELLRRVRAVEPDAYIIFKPHPDVEAGHRPGYVCEDDALRFANAITRNTSLVRWLDAVDAVHVLTSLAGFEALLRGREVVVHGQPFYAGWGLTRDLAPVPWRKRALTLDELVAGSLLLYPRYLDPQTGLPCPPEVLLHRFVKHRKASASTLNRVRQLQGKLRRWLWSMQARVVEAQS